MNPDFIELIRRHQPTVFRIVHGLLRDEVAAEMITQQVFARMHRHLRRGLDDTTAATWWIYHASLRFSCRYYWTSTPPAIRRRLSENRLGEFRIRNLVYVLVRQPSTLHEHDCELIGLRYILGLPLAHIAQLLRMHPYEVSNRLVWSLERLHESEPASEADVLSLSGLSHALSA